MRPQGRQLFQLLQAKLKQTPWWNEGEDEIKLSCPPQCPNHGRDDEHKLYVKAYHDINAHGEIEMPAGVWTCFRCKTAFCEGGGLNKLIGKISTDRPDYAQREMDETLKRANQAKKAHGWIHPGQTIRLDSLDDKHPAAWYWRKRGYDHKLLGSFYGVEWCEASGGFHRMPDGRQSYDREGWLSTANHFIFPVVMLQKRIGWQARSLGEPKPLLWVETTPADTATGKPPTGYWADLPADYPIERYEEFDPISNKMKQKYRGRPGDEIACPPKYFHFFDKGSSLGHFDLAKNFGVTVVTEGWTKAYRVGRCATVTFGKLLTERQIRMLGSHWNKVVLLLDRDAKNLYFDRVDPKTRMVRPGYVTQLRDMTEVHAVTLDGYDDPGDAPHHEIWRQITEKTGILEPINNYDT